MFHVYYLPTNGENGISIAIKISRINNLYNLEVIKFSFGSKFFCEILKINHILYFKKIVITKNKIFYNAKIISLLKKAVRKNIVHKRK